MTSGILAVVRHLLEGRRGGDPMKRVRAMVVLVAIVGLAAGCGTGSAKATTKKPPAGSTVDRLRVASVPSDQLLATKLGRSLVKPPGTADLLPHPTAARQTVGSIGPWHLSLKSQNGQYLLITTHTADCYSLWRISLEESGQSVVITPELSSPIHPPRCPAVAINRLWLVDLGSPLGNRKLLHPRVTAKLGSTVAVVAS